MDKNKIEIEIKKLFEEIEEHLTAIKLCYDKIFEMW